MSIIGRAGQASVRRARLSSNVRPRGRVTLVTTVPNSPMPRTTDALRLRIEAGERNFEAEDLDDSVHDLQCMDLQGVNFSGAFLFANFRGANLKSSKFTCANVKTCDFSSADLRQADFSGAAIDGAVFTAADLEDTNFLGATEQGHVYTAGELPWSR